MTSCFKVSAISVRKSLHAILYFSTSRTHLRAKGTDAGGSLMVDYLQKEHAMHDTYFVSLLRRLGENSNSSDLQKLRKCALFHQNNVSFQKSVICHAFDLIANPPIHLLSLVRQAFICFRRLKKTLLVPSFGQLMTSYIQYDQDLIVTSSPYTAGKSV